MSSNQPFRKKKQQQKAYNVNAEREWSVFRSSINADAQEYLRITLLYIVTKAYSNREPFTEGISQRIAQINTEG